MIPLILRLCAVAFTLFPIAASVHVAFGDTHGFMHGFSHPHQKTTRLFYPNYFNTFCARLRADSRYATLVGNRSTVLRLMGKIDEADKFGQEAEDFTPP